MIEMSLDSDLNKKTRTMLSARVFFILKRCFIKNTIVFLDKAYPALATCCKQGANYYLTIFFLKYFSWAYQKKTQAFGLGLEL